MILVNNNGKLQWENDEYNQVAYICFNKITQYSSLKESIPGFK